MKTNNNSGVILVAVVCFTAITAILALGLLSESSSQLKLADRQVRLEQAFYVAEGGAERAVACIANSGGTPSGVITGAIGNGTFCAAFDSVSGSGGQTWYTIVSTGEVSGIKRGVMMTGVRQDSWARYALWYDHSGGPIYFRAGETNNGPIHSNTNIYLEDNPVFNGPVTCVPTNWGQWSAAAIFSNGFQLGVNPQSMASVNFTNLLSAASIVVTGATQIRLAGTNMIASNAGRGWTNATVAIPANGLIYVSGGATGTVQVGGQLDGALTIVADYDIKITNNITYAVHPTNDSDDALGLIAQHDVEVATSAPSNLNVFAHIISCNNATDYDAGFHVEDYDGRANSGKLTVYGLSLIHI